MPTLGFIRLTTSDWYMAVAALVLALVATCFYYRRTVPPIPRRIKIPLVALRTIALLALFLALADALWASLRREENLHDLVVLIDRSASMEQKDDAGSSRFDRAEDYCHDQIEKDLGGHAKIEKFYFDEDLLSPEAMPDSFGSSTALGTALSALSERARELQPRAAVVLSDGATNRGIEPASAAGRLGVPIITVGFGEVVGAEARVIDAEAPEVVFTGQPFEMRAVVQSGDRDENVTVRLSSGGQTINQQALSLSSGGAQTPVTFSCTVDEPGVKGYRLDVLGADGRSTPTAGRTVFVRALKGRLQVLLLGCTLDWEYTYLLRWLSQQPRIDLTAHVEGSTKLGAPLPSEAEWANFDVAIILHPTVAQLNSLWAPHASGFARSGHGVAFVLNERFSEVAIQSPPYPFEFARGNVFNMPGEYTLQPLPTRQNHPLVRFNPDHDWNQTLEAWTERPPWVQMNCFNNLPADADVLVNAHELASAGDCAAMWTRTSKGGKSLVITGGPLWRWVADRASRGEDATEYNALWNNTIRWLSLRDDTDRLAVRSDRQIYHIGEPIVLDASVFDEVYRFLDRAEVTARVWADSAATDTLRVFLPPGEGNRFVGRLSHLAPGTYRYDGAAVVSDATLPLAGDIFRVEPYGLEQQYVSLNEGVLKGVALQTGGRYYREGEKPAYLDSLDWTATVTENLVEIPLWNQTPVLAIFVIALTAEWFIRRRKQLL